MCDGGLKDLWLGREELAQESGLILRVVFTYVVCPVASNSERPATFDAGEERVGGRVGHGEWGLMREWKEM